MVQLFLKIVGEFAVEFFAKDFDTQLEIQAQAARVEIGGANHRIVVVDQKGLGVDKRCGLGKHLEALRKNVLYAMLSRPVGHVDIRSLGQQNSDVDAP